MAKQPRFSSGVGLVILFIGVSALVAKSGHGSLIQAALGSLFFFLVALYFALRSFMREENWWLVLPAGLCFTVGLMVVLRSLALLKPGLLWVIFFCGMALTLFLYGKYRTAPGPANWPRNGALLCAILAGYRYLQVLHIMDPLLLAAVLLMAGGAWLVLLNKK
ncbi:MAG TPA: hypothetical protein PKI62_08180 [bacterium]|nr:hypothetical protein [bacterium]HPR88449.1 hypothetical protein [bacterium]